MKSLIQGIMNNSIAIIKKLQSSDVVARQLEELVDVSINSIGRGGKIIFAGNGGSYADAQHLSAELTSRFMFNRAPIASLALGTNGSSISAIGNDYGYEHVFSRELKGIACRGDIFIGISTSGNSLNIFNAASMAEELGLYTSVWTGKTGGLMAQKFNCLHIPSDETARIQEAQILVGHIYCQILEDRIFGGVK